MPMPGDHFKQERADKIRLLRESGLTLAQIGDIFALTKERVRQILVQTCGTTRLSRLLSRHQVERSLGCSDRTLVRLERAGKLHPTVGKLARLYSPEEVEKARLLTARVCRLCGEPFAYPQRRLCVKCAKEFQRYSYPHLSEEKKQILHAAVRRWQQQHPERTREIARKASKKYEEKRRQQHPEERLSLKLAKLTDEEQAILWALLNKVFAIKPE